MKSMQLSEFKESRRSNDGHVEVRVETAEGELVKITLTPAVSEQILWSILSTVGQTDANNWKLWPLSPDYVIRGLRSDGSMDLTFVQQQRAAFPVRITPDLRKTLLDALSKPSSDRPKDPSKAH